MSGINNNRPGWGNINWKFWQKPKTSPNSQEGCELDEKVKGITTRSLKEGLSDIIPKAIKSKKTPTISADSGKVHLCALPCILPDYFEDTSSEIDSQSIELPIFEDLNQKISHCKEPPIELKPGETIEQVLAALNLEADELKTTQSTSKIEELQEKSSKLTTILHKITVLEELLDVQKEIESSKSDLHNELFSFETEYKQIEKKIPFVNEWLSNKVTPTTFVDELKDALLTCGQYEKQEFLENCHSLQEKSPKALRWIDDKIKGLSKEQDTAFKSVYLKFLISQKALLEKQSEKLTNISDKLTPSLEIHISQNEFKAAKANIAPLWKKLHQTLYKLPDLDKESIRRNLYSFSDDRDAKELCKRLLSRENPVKKISETEMIAALTLIQKMQNSKLFKDDYKITIY